MLSRKGLLQRRVHIFSVILVLTFAITVLFNQIGLSGKIRYHHVQIRYWKNNTIKALDRIICFSSITILPLNKVTDESNPFDNIIPYDDIILFEDVLEAKRKPTPDQTIFFVETSCTRNGLARLSARQACAVESAARWNPQRDVFVLFASPVGFFKGIPSLAMQLLDSYQNIHFRRINYRNFSVGTPAEEFFATNTIFHSTYFIQTFSDVLRLVTLYRYGGIYFDLDAVIQMNLDVLPSNFAGREISTFIANGVLGFSSGGLGHKLVELIIKDVIQKFDPEVWGNAGPQAITRTFKAICNVSEVMDMKPEICGGFNVLPEQTFYPIYGTEWQRFFDASFTNESLEISRKSVAVHFWNTYSKWQPILKDFKNKTLVEKYRKRLTKDPKILNAFGETAYGSLAKKNCPRSYDSSGDLF